MTHSLLPSSHVLLLDAVDTLVTRVMWQLGTSVDDCGGGGMCGRCGGSDRKSVLLKSFLPGFLGKK